MRGLFAHISSLIENGKIISAAAVDSRGLEYAAQLMGADLPLGDDIPSEVKNAPIGSFIIESESDIRGLALKRKNL